MEIDPNFEPLSRPRSSTWPLAPRPELVSINDGNVKHEIEPMEAHLENRGDDDIKPETINPSANAIRKTTARRNAWGNLSYADLITRAIESSPDKRLTLSQIYEWMVKCIPYFRDKGDSNSSAGWKNSIRHNLSLHNRFMRIQNEGTGKSSWWVINPDAKPGKSARRRAGSMDTSNPKFEKKRGRAKKKSMLICNDITLDHQDEGDVSVVAFKWNRSPASQSEGSCDSLNFQTYPNDFRPRTSSSASSIGSHCSRLSPIVANPNNTEFPDVDKELLQPLYGNGDINSAPQSVSEMAFSQTAELIHQTTEKLCDSMTDMMKLDNQVSPLGATVAENIGLLHSQVPLTTASNPSLLSNGYGIQQPQSPYSNSLYGNDAFGTYTMDTHMVPNTQDMIGANTGGYVHMSIPEILQDAILARANDQANGHLMHPDIHPACCAQMTSLSNTLVYAQQQRNLNNMAHMESMPRTVGMSLSHLHSSIPSSQISSMYHMHRGGQPDASANPMNQERFPSDLELDVFKGGFECDMDSIIQNEPDLGDGQIDFNLEPHAANGIYMQTRPTMAAISGCDNPASTHTWVR